MGKKVSRAVSPEEGGEAGEHEQSYAVCYNGPKAVAKTLYIEHTLSADACDESTIVNVRSALGLC